MENNKSTKDFKFQVGDIIVDSEVKDQQESSSNYIEYTVMYRLENKDKGELCYGLEYESEFNFYVTIKSASFVDSSYDKIGTEENIVKPL